MNNDKFEFKENMEVKLQLLEEGLHDSLLQHAIYAKMVKGIYNNFIEVGFTEEQALFLARNT